MAGGSPTLGRTHHRTAVPRWEYADVADQTTRLPTPARRERSATSGRSSLEIHRVYNETTYQAKNGDDWGENQQSVESDTDFVENHPIRRRSTSSSRTRLRTSAADRGATPPSRTVNRHGVHIHGVASGESRRPICARTCGSERTVALAVLTGLEARTRRFGEGCHCHRPLSGHSGTTWLPRYRAA